MAKKPVAVSLRKPPSPEAMDQFVQGEPAAPPSSGTVPAKRRGRGKTNPSERAAVAEPSPCPPSVEPIVEPLAPAPEATRGATPISASISEPLPEPLIREAARESAPPTIPGPPAIEPTPESPVVGPSGQTLRPVTIYLPPALAERLALHCIQMDRDVSNVIGDALENHLSPRLGSGAQPGPSQKPNDAPRGERASGFWTEPPFPYVEWPPRRIDQIIQLGKVLLGFVRRRPQAA